ncbi:MAG: radical SAM protein, partial [Candidatus Bathyarchaeia archaeon]
MVKILGKCSVCGISSPLVSSNLGVCSKCIKEKPEEALKVVSRVREVSRRSFNLPSSVPKSPEGVKCGMCRNECAIPSGEKGFCGLSYNVEGSLTRLG